MGRADRTSWVLKTFLLFFTWYCLFIVAFGLGFFIMLHKEVVKDSKEDEYVFFNKAWLSLVKTTTMFVGELEFSDIPIDLDSHLAPLSYVFFLSFFFLIVIVLMNLLNGLAVSDTGLIREKAEIYSYRCQVETISTLESMLLGDPFDFLSSVPALLSGLPSCSLRMDDVGKSIVAAAKEIVIKQRMSSKTSQEDDEETKNKFQLRVDSRLKSLEDKVDGLENKIDRILSSITLAGRS